MDYTSIEGRLEVISVHERQTITVWESLTNHEVKCLVTDEQMQQAHALLGKRVSVTGRVHYRNHVPRQIHVEGPIKQLRETKDLPQPSYIGPIDITGDLSSERMLKRSRKPPSPTTEKSRRPLQPNQLPAMTPEQAIFLALNTKPIHQTAKKPAKRPRQKPKPDR